jgi:glycine oxidase
MTVPGVVRVLGGGIIGLTAAYHMAQAGLRVELFDRGPLGAEASWAGAGILPPGNPAHAATAYDRLRAESVSQFEAFTAELEATTGLPTGYWRCGGVELLTEHERSVPELWQQEGISFTAYQPQDATLRIPADATAYTLPGFAQVRNPWHLRALIAGCQRLGVQLHPHTPWQTLTLNPDHATVFCLGAWTAEALRPWGVTLPVKPLLGQILLLKPVAPMLHQIVLYGKRYLVPRADGRVLVGSTEEPEAGYEKRTTAEARAALRTLAIELCPALATAEVEHCWAGLRPASADGMPYLGSVPGLPTWFVATGHTRAGVQLSLSTARIVTDWAVGRLNESSISAFALDRTPHNSTSVAAFRS